MCKVDWNQDRCQQQQEKQVLDEVWNLVEESAEGSILELIRCDHLDLCAYSIKSLIYNFN